MMRAGIVHDEIRTAALISEVAATGNGATSVFLGTVRDVNDGREVRGIEYSAYDDMAVAEIGRVLEEAGARFGVGDAVVEHRVGMLAVGEVSIAVVVASPHRAAALEATRYIVDETKKRAPIWKLEHYADGTREWVGAPGTAA
jgi:molybdopterin synthase catalytic subunit